MLNLLRCYLSGRHESQIGYEPGTIFLHCPHCGQRSSGWTVDARVPPTAAVAAVPAPAAASVAVANTASRFRAARVRTAGPAAVGGRVLPFARAAAH